MGPVEAEGVPPPQSALTRLTSPPTHRTNSDRPKPPPGPTQIATIEKYQTQKCSRSDRPKFKSTKPKNVLEVSNTDDPKLKNTKQRICFYYYIPLFSGFQLGHRQKLKSTKYLPLQFLPAADMFSIQVGFAFEIKFSINDLIEIIVS